MSAIVAKVTLLSLEEKRQVRVRKPMKLARFRNIMKLKRLRMLQDSLGPFYRLVSSDNCEPEQILLRELPAPFGKSSKSAA